MSESQAKRGYYHPDPEINAEVAADVLEAERVDLAAGCRWRSSMSDRSRLEGVAGLIAMCGEEASVKALTSALDNLAKVIEERDEARAAARAFAKAMQWHLDTFGYDNHEGLADALAAHPGWEA